MPEEEKKENTKVSLEREVFDWLETLVTVVLTVVLFFTFISRQIGVDGTSMLPTLQDKDRLMVITPIFYDDYKYGDIVVLRKDSFLSSAIVKRVIATGGQTVDIDFLEGSVYVDGEELDEPYINARTYTPEGIEFPLTVPEGSVFVLGDNRNDSSDSRHIRLGTVDTRYIVGKAVLMLFPGPDSETGKRNFRRIGLVD